MPLYTILHQVVPGMDCFATMHMLYHPPTDKSAFCVIFLDAKVGQLEESPSLASSSNPGGLCHVQLITVISLVPEKPIAVIVYSL